MFDSISGVCVLGYFEQVAAALVHTHAKSNSPTVSRIFKNGQIKSMLTYFLWQADCSIETQWQQIKPTKKSHNFI